MSVGVVAVEDQDAATLVRSPPPPNQLHSLHFVPCQSPCSLYHVSLPAVCTMSHAITRNLPQAAACAKINCIPSQSPHSLYQSMRSASLISRADGRGSAGGEGGGGRGEGGGG
eukprot:3789573-Rhodomonas_salina.1